MKTIPFAGVKLVEFTDRLELMPYGWVRDCVALGRRNANEFFDPSDAYYEKWKAKMGDNEIFVVVNWRVFEDESDEVDRVIYCNPNYTLEHAQRVFQGMVDYLDSKPVDRDTMAGIEKYKMLMKRLAPSSVGWIRQLNIDRNEEEPGDTSAIVHNYSDQKTNETRDLYQARLKALAGIQPKTVGLIVQADQTKDDVQRKKFEREAVQAYFAEVATYWSDDMLMAWQRKNPVGSKWLCEFANVMQEPERELDPINHELALNWLRRGYNLLTENELSDAILKATGQRVMPNTLKKKRANQLGLTARPFGRRPNSEL